MFFRTIFIFTAAVLLILSAVRLPLSPNVLRPNFFSSSKEIPPTPFKLARSLFIGVQQSRIRRLVYFFDCYDPNLNPGKDYDIEL